MTTDGHRGVRIAIASGKGGTGKTTVATNLARVLARSRRVQYLDCDVEEPNGHLFLQPQIDDTHLAGIPVPEVDAARCTGCGACSRLCQYHAIAVLGPTALTFPELCHGCGGCVRVCLHGAIREVERPIGVVERGTARGIDFVQGRLNVGETMSPPLIRAVTRLIDPQAIAILDAPPGTSCPAIAAIRGCDLLVLVTEPTAFGLHDLTLAVDMARAIGLSADVVLNRADMGDQRVERYCDAENITIWERIPDDRRVAEAYAQGLLAVDAVPEMEGHFAALADRLLTEAGA